MDRRTTIGTRLSEIVERIRFLEVVKMTLGVKLAKIVSNFLGLLLIDSSWHQLR